MRRKGLYLLACVFLLMVGCISNAEQKKAEASEGVLYVPVLNQTEGQKVIESLSKAYGDNPNVTGDFIGSIRCPYFWRDIILTEIHWSFRYGVIRCGHGRYWKMYQEARLSVSK